MWKLALRNALGQRRRTAFVLLSLALAAFFLVGGSSILYSIKRNIVTGLREGVTGDLQLFDARNPPLDLTEEVPVDYAMIESPELVIALLMAQPEVQAVSPRLMATGMFSAGKQTSPVVLVGIDPQGDVAVVPGLRAEAGERLGAAGQVLIGPGLAGRLGLAPGEGVTALLPTADGLFEGDEFRVCGVYAPAGLPLLGELFAYVSLADLQFLLGREGQAGSLVVRLRPGSDPAQAARRLERLLGDAGHALRVRTWDEVGGSLLGVTRVSTLGLGFGFALLTLIVAFAVANTSLIVIGERTAEIGTMLALGTRRASVLGMILGETGALAALAAAAGTALGWLLCLLLGAVGVPSLTPAMAYAVGGERFYPACTAGHLALAFSLVVLVSLLAALYPAIRASRLDPVAALRAA